MLIYTLQFAAVWFAVSVAAGMLFGRFTANQDEDEE